jgi:hypothetical protein
MLSLSIVFSFCLLIQAAPSGGEQLHSISVTSVCDLVREVDKFHRKRIKVSANLESDGMHGDWLEHPLCPEVAVAIFYPPQSRKHSDITNLEEIILRGGGRAGTIEKEIKGTFVGRFIRRRRPVTKYILELEAVSDLHVTPRKR